MKFLFLFFLFYKQIFAFCVYVPCEPSVGINTTIFTTTLEKGFLKINYKIHEIENNYLEYKNILDKNNELYVKNKTLKVEYLLILKEIIEKQNTLKNIKSLDGE